jgi:hypothetical protein
MKSVTQALCSPGRLFDVTTRFLLIALFVTGTSVACTPKYIPNTDVDDTEPNRKIVEFCEEYRRAVEKRNIALLLKLAHPSYYEDGGNIDATDDLDYAGLRDYLESRFAETRAIRYEIRYRRVGEGRKNTVYVDYTYSASYKIPTPQGEIWQRKVADNRLELLPEGETFRILAGM